MKKVDNLEEESLQWELSMEGVGRRRWNRRLAAVLGTHGLRSRGGLVGRRTVDLLNSRDLGLQLSLQLGLSLDEREKSGEGVAVKVGGLLLALQRGVEKREPRAEWFKGHSAGFLEVGEEKGESDSFSKSLAREESEVRSCERGERGSLLFFEWGVS